MDSMLPSTNPLDDPLLAALRAADPVDASTLPDADSPGPQALLEELLMPTHVRALDELQRINASSTPAPLRRRRRPFALAAGTAAAAAAVLAATFMLPVPGASPEAAAAVRVAAATTAEASAESGRAVSTFSIGGLPTNLVSTGSVTGDVRGAFSGTDLEAVMDLDAEAKSVIGALAPEGTAFPLEVRVVGSTGYFRSGDGPWSAETAAEPTQLDARDALAALLEVTEARDAGTTTIDEVEVTHYEATIVLSKDAADDVVVGAATVLGGVGADGTVDLDVYVAPGNLIRRLVVVGTFDNIPGLGQLTLESTTDFTEFGQPIVIEAPAGVSPGN